MIDSLHTLFLAATAAGMLLMASIASAGSTNGKNYTNFGDDLIAPLFPVNGVLNIYQNKTDTTPRVTISRTAIQLRENARSAEWMDGFIAT